MSPQSFHRQMTLACFNFYFQGCCTSGCRKCFCMVNKSWLQAWFFSECMFCLLVIIHWRCVDNWVQLFSSRGIEQETNLSHEGVAIQEYICSMAYKAAKEVKTFTQQASYCICVQYNHQTVIHVVDINNNNYYYCCAIFLLNKLLACLINLLGAFKKPRHLLERNYDLIN